MDNKLAIALPIDCYFDSIVNWLTEYYVPDNGLAIIFRTTPVSTESKCQMYLILRNMSKYLKDHPSVGEPFEYFQMVRFQNYVDGYDIKIGAVEVIRKQKENQILLLSLRKSEYQRVVDLFFNDLKEEFFPTKVFMPMIDPALIAELDEFGVNENRIIVVDEKTKNRIVELWTQNVIISKIANNVSCSESTVKRVLRKLNLYRRKKKTDPIS